ncbi:MAG: general secretion pathway protein GspC [Myxococcales bacterium]|nr:general secretion pathway protein GspC [Myxococcales bacterium]
MTSPRERRIAIAIVLSTLALAAFFFAQGTVSLVATSLLGAGDPTPIDTPRATADSSASKHRDATAMLQRNIFDSESGDMTKLPEPAADTTAPLVEDANAPPTKCDGGTRLVAAVVSDKNPDWSFAAIADSAGKTLLYRKGSEVSGKRVVTVESERVVLAPTSGGRQCELTMFASLTANVAPTPSAPATPAAPVEPPSDGRIPESELQEGISRVSDTKYNVTRALVTKLLGNQAEIMRSARIIPHEENGVVVGVKLYGIRRNSLLGQLGLQNGDMLRTINGFDMTSPDKALEAYARLQTAQDITVSAVRRGQPTNIEYAITE